MRERWFGATGRRVPEIAVEGELELGDALVLDQVSDAESLHEAHEAGRPIVVRAANAEQIKAALALELLGNPRCVPGHWGTFPLLAGTPAELAGLTDALVEKIEPGDTVNL